MWCEQCLVCISDPTHSLLNSKFWSERSEYYILKNLNMVSILRHFYSLFFLIILELHTIVISILSLHVSILEKRKAFVFVPLPTSMSDGRTEVISLFCVYNTLHPLSMYCVLAPFFIKQCHKQHCCNSNFISAKCLPPIGEALRVECTSL